jgi:hypothetical protein
MKTVFANGYVLSADFADGKPRIRVLEVGRRLGAELGDEGLIAASAVATCGDYGDETQTIESAGVSGGVWLTEVQAYAWLGAAYRGQLEPADLVTRQVVQAFVDLRAGRTEIIALHAPIAPPFPKEERQGPNGAEYKMNEWSMLYLYLRIARDEPAGKDHRATIAKVIRTFELRRLGLTGTSPSHLA